MTKYFCIRIKAINMRREGKTYAEISKVTDISLSTLNRWLSRVIISDSAKTLILKRKCEANTEARRLAWLKARQLRLIDNFGEL